MATLSVVELAVKGRVKNLNVEFETFGMQLNELGHSILSSHTILCCEPDRFQVTEVIPC